MKKIIIIILIILFLIININSQNIINKDLVIKQLQDEKNELIKSLQDTLSEYDKLKIQYNNTVDDLNKETNRANEYLKMVKEMQLKILDNNIILNKVKEEKKAKLSDFIRFGINFETSFKSKDNKFNFDTWYIGPQFLIIDKILLNIEAGYTFDFNFKIGIGILIY